MAINCDIVLRGGATPEELTDLGGALWRWYSRSRGDAVPCQYVDNQALADLLAGAYPALSRSPRLAGRRFVRFRVPAEAYRDRRAILDSLRRDVPSRGVEDVLVDGQSWGVPTDGRNHGQDLPPAPSQA
jgi:hypothetical protein